MDCIARQPPLSVGFPRQEYWSGLHFLLQGIFPTRGLNLLLLLDTWEAPTIYVTSSIKCILRAKLSQFPLGVALAEPEAFRA